MNTNPTENEYFITFDLDHRQSVVIESINLDNKSRQGFFDEEHKKAYEIVKNIVKQNGQKRYNSQNIKDNIHNSIFQDTYNNIVLFHGNRGSGKTSAMLSFAKYLENISIDKCTFKLLPLIDPSLFRDSNNILHTVLSAMFNCAKKHFENDHIQSNDNDNFKTLLKVFSKVFDNLQKMNSLTNKIFDIEYLNTLSDASDIKSNIQHLIKEYLKFIGVNDKSYLVLMIDDMDMNMRNAPEMLEQIQKFLIQENLIILMASRLGQIQLEMKNHYGKFLDSVGKQENIEMEIDDVTNKYLFKFFPPAHRINIDNSPIKLFHTKIKFVIREDNGTYKKDSDLQRYENKDLQTVILNLIWRKTRLIFTPRINRLHPIIPTNLRSLSQFVYILLDMPDAEYQSNLSDNIKQNQYLFKDEKSYYAVRRNLKQFKNFFIEIWIGGNLPYDEQLVFRHIPENGGEINKYLIQKINEVGYKYKEKILIKNNTKNCDINKNDEIYTMVSPHHPIFKKANEVSDIGVYHSNSSTGDLLIVIDSYEKYFESDRELNFIEAVKIYYSICMLEFMFFKEYSNDGMGFITPIIELIGGTIYAQCQFKIIQIEGENGRYLNLDNQNQYIYNFPLKIENKSIISSEDKNFPMEYFISYYGLKKPDRFFRKHIYDTKLDVEGEENYIRFDIFSLLVNLLNLDNTLKRAGISLESNNVVKEWDEFNAVKLSNNVKETIRYRNSILPIYSLDLLFTYFRYPWTIKEDDFVSLSSGISNPINDFISNLLIKNMGYAYKLKLFSDFNSIKKDIIDFLSAIEPLISIQIKKGRSNHKFLTKDKKKNIEYFINSITEENIYEVDFIMETNLNISDTIITGDIEIEKMGMVILSNDDKKISITDLKEAFASQHDQDVLLDDVETIGNRNLTIIKTYKESFEKNIQRYIEKKQFCNDYYKHLLSITTKKCLDRISVKDEEGLGDISSLYKNVFEKSCQILRLNDNFENNN